MKNIKNKMKNIKPELECAILSEKALKEIWDSKEEDKAWKDL
jgi:hypothetical protein